MRFPLALYPAVTLAGLLLAQAAPAQTFPAEDSPFGESKGRIGGLVVSAQTGELLKGASVSLRKTAARPGDDEPRISVITGLDGRFLFTGLPTGRYELSIRKSGYHARVHPAHRIPLGRDDSVTGLLTKLWRPGAITGQVLNADGEPLPDAQVKAYRMTYRGGRPFLETKGTDTADDRGEYRIFDLSPAKYLIGASRKQAQAPPGELRFAYADSFYPNAADPAAAVPVKLAWGEEASGIDLQLSPAAETAVAGVVFDELNGGPCPKCMVSFRSDAFLGQHSRSVTTRSDGAFFVRGLAPGSYQVTATTIGLRPRSAVQAVQIAAGEVAEVMLVTSAGTTVSGKVVFEDSDQGNVSVPDTLSAILIPEPGRWALIMPARVSHDDGSFVLENVPAGTFRVDLAPLPPGGYLKSLRIARRMLPAPEVSVGDTELADVVVQIGFDGGTIRGVVGARTSSNKEPVHPGVVVLLPRDSEPGYRRESFTRHGTDGRFEFTGVPPGRYVLFAAPSRQSFELRDPEVRSRLQKFGENVDLDSNEQVSVELVALREPARPQ